MPVLHINDESRILRHARITPLEPVIKPAHGLIAPLHLRARHCVIRKSMVPRPDDRLDRSLRLHEHVGHVVAIAIEQTADQKCRSRDLTERPDTIPPEWTI